MGELETESLKVTVEPSGTLTVVDKTSGAVYSGLNGLRDVGDRGDTYNHDPVPGDRPLVHSGEHTEIWIERGPVRRTLRVTREWSLPVGLREDRAARSPEQVPLVVSEP